MGNPQFTLTENMTFEYKARNRAPQNFDWEKANFVDIPQDYQQQKRSPREFGFQEHLYKKMPQ